MLVHALKIAALLFALTVGGIAAMAWLAGDRTNVPFLYELSD